MDSLNKLMKEHEKIESYLKELDVIMNSEPINKPSLVHFLKTLSSFWDTHELKEEKIFGSFSKKGYKIPKEEIEFEHGILNKYLTDIMNALSSTDEDLLIRVLRTEGKKLIDKLRTHMEKEDWILIALNDNRLDAQYLE